MGLFVSLMGPALIFPNLTLADAGKSPPYMRIGQTKDTVEGGVSLRGETLKLEAVLAYARERNPAIRAAKSRSLAAQKVPCPGLRLRGPQSVLGSLECP